MARLDSGNVAELIDLGPILGYYLTTDGFKFANISHNPILIPG